MDLILASQSPRRRELLRQMGLTDFTVCPARIDEVVDASLTPQEVVTGLSRQKAAAVAARFPGALVLAADTVVVCDGNLLGKPHSPEEATAMLAMLSGRVHQVLTGFTLRRGEDAESGCEETEVSFRELSQGEIAAYVRTGEPMDKAGAYGIQGLGALLVRGIRGDYFNVMGLPVCRLGMALRNFGVDCLGAPVPAPQAGR